MVERNAFLANPKHLYPVFQCGEHGCSANNKKNGDYYEFPSLSHLGWTSIIWKMIERKTFLANSKHQYRVSKWREHDGNAHNKKNGYCYKYPSLSYFTDEH